MIFGQEINNEPNFAWICALWVDRDSSKDHEFFKEQVVAIAMALLVERSPVRAGFSPSCFE
jgi:hypothetical protein